MRVSEFWRLMEDEFGPAYAGSLARDVVLSAAGGRSAVDALDAGVDPKSIWLAICELQDVPLDRRFGKDVRAKRSR